MFSKNALDVFTKFSPVLLSFDLKCFVDRCPEGHESLVVPWSFMVISIIDRLIHHSEIFVLEGESYRFREAKERTSRKKLSPAT